MISRTPTEVLKIISEKIAALARHSKKCKEIARRAQPVPGHTFVISLSDGRRALSLHNASSDPNEATSLLCTSTTKREKLYDNSYQLVQTSLSDPFNPAGNEIYTVNNRSASLPREDYELERVIISESTYLEADPRNLQEEKAVALYQFYATLRAAIFQMKQWQVDSYSANPEVASHFQGYIFNVDVGSFPEEEKTGKEVKEWMESVERGLKEKMKAKGLTYKTYKEVSESLITPVKVSSKFEEEKELSVEALRQLVLAHDFYSQAENPYVKELNNMIWALPVEDGRVSKLVELSGKIKRILAEKKDEIDNYEFKQNADPDVVRAFLADKGNAAVLDIKNAIQERLLTEEVLNVHRIWATKVARALFNVLALIPVAGWAMGAVKYCMTSSFFYNFSTATHNKAQALHKKTMPMPLRPR